ncbi:hypothetical protein COL10_11490 [Bacillus cereus]|uniref:DUF4179 domain-containing protein n=1 Tax=Bacillus cereus TaxID=1396 RepID=UPI000BF65860|nr:DUF4179 domain-containing protein [Bacillus cereus]PFD75019.1 hypothetical protein CN301_08210 [Bacillus cereus]PFV11763.1 hypothetical protein COL10_11490 [Bacillus cereus]PGV40867.1 hypothetical protein COD74_23975 [Bacillus cereus]
MKDPYEMLNDIKMDENEYEEINLTHIEKKKMKKRIRKKLKTNKAHTKRNVTIVTSAAALFIMMMTVDMRRMIADIPLIGSKMEDYVNSRGEPLKEYKTTIGQIVYDNGVEVRLDEVIIDEGQIIVNSTFKSNRINLEESHPSPDIYINGKLLNGSGTGGEKKINEYTYTFFSNKDLKDDEMNPLEIRGECDIQVVYRDIVLEQGKSTWKGEWGFSFKASGDKLKAETRTIPIRKNFKLENGQKIEVEDLKVSPISTKLNYKMLNGTKVDVTFIGKDQDGKELKLDSGLTLSKNSYWRFEKLEDRVTKIILTPVLTSGEEGEKKTDYRKVLTEEEFEVVIKE